MTQFKVVARCSPLSQIQVQEVVQLRPDLELDIDMMPTLGDHDKASSLRDPVVSDFFTRELDEAILKGYADIAIHSAKDLPVPLHPDLRVVALLPCYEASDSLVSRGNLSLVELSSGACVATSSKHRQQAIADLRDDLNYRDIRGTIEDRIAQIDEGLADAVVVATCALQRLGLQDRIAEVLPIETWPLQGHLAIVAHRDRPDLVKLWASSNIRQGFGKVYLAGFGPGNPELITVKTHRLIQESDVILYDDLIDPSILRDMPGEAIYVGKRKGVHYRSQKEINRLIKDKAWQGLQVLRLKGGDPCIFGRVGEEVEWLQQWMIPFEIIPGVTSAMAAAASQNISLTQRGVSKTFSFLTGHHAQNRQIEVPPVDTIVYYMAATELETLAKHLLREGRLPDEPVLLVQNATFAHEVSELKTVSTMAQTSLSSPLMVIVGYVAKRAIPTHCVLYTGLDARRYRSLYKVVHYPLIRTKFVGLDPAGKPRDDVAQYDALLFTSREAVRYFYSKHRVCRDQEVLAIGSGTENLLQDYGVHVSHKAEQPHSDAMVALLETLSYRSYLYPCSSLSNNALHTHDKVTPWVIYTTEPVLQDPVDLNVFDWIVFTSPSTVNSFLQIYPFLPEHVVYEVLGPFTRQALNDHGIKDTSIVG